MMGAQPQPRDSAGKFAGERFDVERLPMLPGTIAAEALRARQPVVCVWAGPSAARVAEFVVIVEPDPSHRDFVRVCPVGAIPTWVRVIRQPCPPQGSTRVVWCCPSCARRAQHLFVGLKPDTSALVLACRVCLGLHFSSRGGSRIRKALARSLAGIEPGAPLPRNPCIPTIVTRDRKCLKRFVNLVVEEVPTEAPSAVTGGPVD